MFVLAPKLIDSSTGLEDASGDRRRTPAPELTGEEDPSKNAEIGEFFGKSLCFSLKDSDDFSLNMKGERAETKEGWSELRTGLRGLDVSKLNFWCGGREKNLRIRRECLMSLSEVLGRI